MQKYRSDRTITTTREAMNSIRFKMKLIIVSLFLYAPSNQLYANTDSAQEKKYEICLEKKTLSPGQTEVINYTKKTGVAMSTSVQMNGAITTADGRNKLKKIWVNRKSPFHWGSSKDLGDDIGPIFRLSNRTTSAGYLYLEMRATAYDTVTTLCLCSYIDADKEILPGNQEDYLRRMSECRKEKGLN